MVSYLAQAGFLLPGYRPGSERRGSTRYFSYRDLVIARLVARLSAAGVELKRLKASLRSFQESDVWMRLGPEAACALLVTDGATIMVHEEDGSILDLTRGGQLAFAFVMDLQATDAELRSAVDDDRRHNYTYELHPLKGL
jgi:DNA-binding transcriptional MerR regulator